LVLFIFESIGTSELILVGIVALVFLGPRKLPEMARKMGKMMAEFRGTASEFKETWQREANFEEEAKAFDLSDLEPEPIARTQANPDETPILTPSVPAVKSMDPSTFNFPPAEGASSENIDLPTETSQTNDKKTWL